MATSPTVKSPKKEKKEGNEGSFFDKLGTLGRKKKAKEVADLQEEGKQSIEDPMNPKSHINPEAFALALNLEEGDERVMIHPQSKEDPKFLELLKLLLDWINDELAEQRIVVKDIAEDFFDGQILQKLIEKLTLIRVEAPEVTQSEVGQRQKLTVVLDVINRVLGIPLDEAPRWSVEAIHSKNLLAIVRLLICLAQQFKAPIRFPERLVVTLDVIQIRGGKPLHNTMQEDLTTYAQDRGGGMERDQVDVLVDSAPEKLVVVIKTLKGFVNRHLTKLDLEVTELESQFSDGVNLIFLMGLLEGYFVPLYDFRLTPSSFEQKVQNITLSFDLMEDAGLQRPLVRPEDIANKDLKATIRVLYSLCSSYKHL